MDLMMGLKRHPHTGELLKPVYVTKGGRICWPVMGASPDDSSNSGTSGDGEPGTGTGEGESGNESGQGNEGAGTSGEATVSREEFERLKGHLSEADKKRSAAEAKLKEIEDAKKDDLTKAQERVAELEKANEESGKEIAQLRLDNAFLRANEVQWHDPKAALMVAEREGYLEGVIKDGKVDEKALAGKLKELAKAKAYLVKTDSGQQQQTPPPSGGAVGSGGKGGKDNGTDEAALTKRYRVLGR